MISKGINPSITIDFNIDEKRLNQSIEANKKNQNAISNLFSNIINKIIGTEKSLRKVMIFAIFIIFTLLNLASYYLNQNLNRIV